MCKTQVIIVSRVDTSLLGCGLFYAAVIMTSSDFTAVPDPSDVRAFKQMPSCSLVPVITAAKPHNVPLLNTSAITPHFHLAKYLELSLGL